MTDKKIPLHKHPHLDEPADDEHKKKIVLVGNPNVGKSLLFNWLSGLYVDVSNFPGTTVEISQGHIGQHILYDTPGIYSVASFNDEECTARDIILDADLVINVVDGVHLERDLFLTIQLIDMGLPVIVALNFMDEVEKEKIKIDVEALETRLNVPVIPISAARKTGLENLVKSIPCARKGAVSETLKHEISDMLNRVGSQPEAVLILEGDVTVAGRHGVPAGIERDRIYLQRRLRVNQIIEQIFQIHSHRSIREWIGRLMIHPVTGIPIVAVVLYLLYQFVGVGIAQYLVGFTEETVGQGVYEPFVRQIIARMAAVNIKADIIHEDHNGHMVTLSSTNFYFPDGTDNDPANYRVLQNYSENGTVIIEYQFYDIWAIFLAGEFGAITMTVTYIFLLLLPLVIGFYFFLSVLEDSGYLPRLATLTDNLLSAIGLNGRAIIPILLGFGCVTMATVSTRLLNTKREKTIATTILNFAIPCSAQLAVITALLARTGGLYVLIFIGILAIALILIGSVLNWTLAGTSSSLLIDLPPMRFPSLDNITRKTIFKSYHFMKEAIPFFFLGSLLVTAMQLTGAMKIWESLFEFITTQWLLLPSESARAFIMGLVRRDFGAAGFLNMDLSASQILTGLVTLTFFVPCIASMIILFKERGSREALLIWFGTWIIAFLIGGILAHILALF